MEYQCVPYEGITGLVFDKPAVTNRTAASDREPNCHSVEVASATSETATLARGAARAEALFGTNSHSPAALIPPVYEKGSRVYSEDVDWPFMV